MFCALSYLIILKKFDLFLQMLKKKQDLVLSKENIIIMQIILCES